MNNADGIADGLFLVISSTTSETPMISIKTENNLHSFTSLPIIQGINTNWMVSNSEYSNRHKGIKLISENNNISVLVLNLLSGSYGEYLAYPCHDLGQENYTYIAVSSTSQLPTAHSQILFVGCQNNTRITIIPTTQVELPWNVQVANDSMFTVKEGESHTFMLNEQQTLVLRSIGDLTGTKVVSDKPLTVVSGHECGNVPHRFGFCEHLTVQIPPSATWGTDFLLVPFANRSLQVYRITKIHNNTTVISKCAGSQAQLVTSSQLPLNNAHCSLSADKPIFVVKLAEGGENDKIGDPVISVVPPVQQYINSVSFFVYPRSFFWYNYIGVTVNNKHFSHDSILLDSRPINCIWTALDSIRNGTLGHACTLTIESGIHTMRHKHENGSFSVIVYGYHQSIHQAYAYNAGMKLNVLTDHNQAGIYTKCIYS